MKILAARAARVAGVSLLLTSGSAVAQNLANDNATAEQPPVPFEATYLAEALGLSATAYRTRSFAGEDTYRLENRVTLTLLGATVGTVTEFSEFRLENQRVVPLLYGYSQTGLSRREELVEFDWNAMSAASTLDAESWSLILQEGVQDKMSYSQSFSHDIGVLGLQEITYSVVDGDEIEEQTYRVAAEEVLSTPLGDLNTVKIERVRSDNSRRRTTVWLATDWHYLLVRLEQVNGSGRETNLSLESATVNGEVLRGL